MPSLDDLGTSQVVSEAPATGDFVPFYDISEFGNNSRVKRTTVSDLIATGLEDVETLTVDWFATTDQSGNEIPAGAYGQKAGIPYFGDTPLAEQMSQRIDFVQISADSFTTGIKKKELGSFPISADRAIDGYRFTARVDIFIDSSLGGVPLHANDKLYLYAQLGAGTPDLTKGTTWRLDVSEFLERRKVDLLVALEEDAANLRVSMTATFQHIENATDASTPAEVLPFSPATTATIGGYYAPENTATAVYFFLVLDADEGAFAMLQATGSIEKIDTDPVTGSAS